MNNHKNTALPCKNQPIWLSLLEESQFRDYLAVVTLADCSPFFFYGKQQELRTFVINAQGAKLDVLTPLDRSFVTEKVSYSLRLFPARIKEKDGTFRDYFAGLREEAILDVLRLLARESAEEIIENKKTFVGIRFTYADIQRRLDKCGMKTSRAQIRHSLLVLAGCSYELTASAPYRKGYLVTESLISALGLPEHTRDSCFVRLNTLLGDGLINASYRLSLFHTVYELNSLLARKLYKILISVAKGISHEAPYHFLLTSFFSRCGFVQNQRISVDARRLREALEELKSKDFIRYYVEEKKKNSSGVLEDYKYSLVPSESFVAQVKLENHRENERNTRMITEKNYGGPYGSGRVR
jgi:hypothetical protein